MSGLKFYVIDTETTGLKSGYHEMTEIGIIRCEDRVQLWRQIKCVYPERANIDALMITKKTLSATTKRTFFRSFKINISRTEFYIK